jgi:hypothetical protein
MASSPDRSGQIGALLVCRMSIPGSESVGLTYPGALRQKRNSWKEELQVQAQTIAPQFPAGSSARLVRNSSSVSDSPLNARTT